MRYIILIGTALCFLFPFVSFSGTSDDSGKDKKQIYPVNQETNLVTNLKIFYDRPKIVVRAVVPQLEIREEINEESISEVEQDWGLAGIKHFNEAVLNLVKEQIDYFKEKINAGRLPSEKSSQNNLYIDYNASLIKSGNNKILSMRFTIQGYASMLKHPFLYYKVLNYDLDKDETLTLDDLFKTDSHYLNLISDYTHRYIKKNIGDLNTKLIGLSPEADHFKNWNLKSNGVLITLEGKQFEPYFSRTQTILIPYSVLRKVIAKDSPISKCIKQKKYCVTSKFLTGGFIDEAVNSKHRVFNPGFG